MFMLFIYSPLVLFIGTVPLQYFRYQEIREFGRATMSSLRDAVPDAEHVALTIHGVNYGLDEFEAFDAQFAGFADAVRNGQIPRGLRKVSFVERNRHRAESLQEHLNRSWGSGLLGRISSPSSEEQLEGTNEQLQAAGYLSDAKSHIFVAMPFVGDMEDTYHYGIQAAVKRAGFLCERADLEHFTGDIMQWVLDRIRTATLLVADLSLSKPNVYLEVGYAWGCNVPTVLLAKDTDELQFDVRGHRCLMYKSIRELEKSLSKELIGLSNK